MECKSEEVKGEPTDSQCTPSSHSQPHTPMDSVKDTDVNSHPTMDPAKDLGLKEEDEEVDPLAVEVEVKDEPIEEVVVAHVPDWATLATTNHRPTMNGAEAVEYLHSLSEEENATGLDIVLEPPGDQAESDADDPSEDSVDGEEIVDLLGAKLSSRPLHIDLTNRNARFEPTSSWSVPVFPLEDPEDASNANTQSDEEEVEPPTKKKKKKDKSKYSWMKCTTEECNDGVPSAQSAHQPSVVKRWSSEAMTPVDVFRVFWDEIVQVIRIETNRYHFAKFGKDLNVTTEELYQVLGILLLSGYNTVPDRRMYWSNESDTRCLAVIQCGMRLNRFEKIVRNLHFADNSRQPSGDKIFKVRPLFEHFNKTFLSLARPIPRTWAIDHVMEPYHSHHGFKHFIRGKPVRFGYKFWCLCSSEGLLISFKLFEGKEMGREKGRTLGESVVESLTRGIVHQGSDGYIDDFFTSLPLLESFRKNGVNLTGKIHKNKVKDIPLSDMRQSERGAAELFADKDKSIVVCQWKDNSEVRVATNKAEISSLGMSKCKRWSKGAKGSVSVPQPVLVQQYNKGMGGIDLFDQYQGKYRVAFRKHAWYYPLFRFLLNASVVNGWLLYRKIDDISQLDFLREIVNDLLNPAKNPTTIVPLNTFINFQYDRVDHNIVIGKFHRRCSVCKERVKYKCTKCDVALHVQCWLKYHTKE